jgi:hypothetical protein
MDEEIMETKVIKLPQSLQDMTEEQRNRIIFAMRVPWAGFGVDDSKCDCAHDKEKYQENK